MLLINKKVKVIKCSKELFDKISPKTNKILDSSFLGCIFPLLIFAVPLSFLAVPNHLTFKQNQVLCHFSVLLWFFSWRIMWPIISYLVKISVILIINGVIPIIMTHSNVTVLDACVTLLNIKIRAAQCCKLTEV